MISPATFEYISEMSRLYYMENHLAQIRDNLRHRLSLLSAYIDSSNITTEVQYGKCGYAGTVLKESYRDQVWWNCPHCGKRYEETLNYYYE